jgi:hypothetical protein
VPENGLHVRANTLRAVQFSAVEEACRVRGQPSLARKGCKRAKPASSSDGEGRCGDVGGLCPRCKWKGVGTAVASCGAKLLRHQQDHPSSSSKKPRTRARPGCGSRRWIQCQICGYDPRLELTGRMGGRNGFGSSIG